MVQDIGLEVHQKMNYEEYRDLSQAALGKTKADLVLKNCNVVDVFTGWVSNSNIAVKDGMILGVSHLYEGDVEVDLAGSYVAPGLIDAHLHLESTMVSPSEFIATAAAYGTTTFIVDPHEAANVSGSAGIDYILAQTANSPANVYVMMPSCVPATHLDDNGGALTVDDMRPYLENERVLGLGEVMDTQSVINADPTMFSKLALFEKHAIDGHCPSLSNQELSAYRLAGIITDHETATFDNALEKVRRGMHVHVREGSAAHNLDMIVQGIIREGILTESFSFCTDDKHIEDILHEGHIDHCVRRAIQLGLDPITSIRMATINAARCYGLKHLGAIAPGFQADFIVFDNLQDFDILDVYHNGKRVPALGAGPAETAPSCPPELRNTVHIKRMSPADFMLPIRTRHTHVIELIDGQIATIDRIEPFTPTANFIPSDGFSKIAVIERHRNTGMIGVAIASGYGIRGGAVASSVSHDSHNVVVIGDNDEDMARAVNEIARVGGGYTIVATDGEPLTLPLPIMGLMSDAGYPNVSAQLALMKEKARKLGVNPKLDPLITLSFMALPVIPEIHITPRGLCKIGEQGPYLLEE